MKHIALSPHAPCDAVSLPALERRCRPDPRMVWRGGRRDTDWVNRPPDAWARAGDAGRRSNRWLRQLLQG